MLFVVTFALLLVSSAAFAGDFDWVGDFNFRAEADSAGFRARLAARFDIGGVQINAVLSNVERPADAYILLRLVEMSSQPVDYVIKKYRSGKGRGALARGFLLWRSTIKLQDECRT